MFDAKEIIDQVKRGNYSTNWHVYRGAGMYGCAVTAGIIAACITAGIIWVETLLSTLMNPLLFLILGIPCMVCIIATFALWYNANSNARSILVLLPEGAVQYYAGRPKSFLWLYFPIIHKIELAQETDISGTDGDVSSRTDYWLDVYWHDGTYRKWDIRDCFGDQASRGKAIIAAYNYYWYQQGS